jgi:hypothetical protein
MRPGVASCGTEPQPRRGWCCGVVSTIDAAAVYSRWSGNKNGAGGQRTRVPRNCSEPSYVSSFRRGRCDLEKAMLCWCELLFARVFSGNAESRKRLQPSGPRVRSRLAWHVRVRTLRPGSCRVWLARTRRLLHVGVHSLFSLTKHVSMPTRVHPEDPFR